MSTLTQKQIETFDTFATAIEDYLDSISEKTSAGFRTVTQIGFGDLLIAASRPSYLQPVMNNLTSLEKIGRTKEAFQLRFPETLENGNPHPQANQLRFKVNGDPILSKPHCVMYTLEAYRAMRSKATDLKTPETIYGVSTVNIPEKIRLAFRAKFPVNPKNEEGEYKYPLFKATGIGIVARKGKKVPKGQKRHSWAGFDILVLGTYGDQEVIITQAAVMERGSTANIAKAVGTDCPDWGQNDKAEVQTDDPQEVMKEAASGLMTRGLNMLDGFFTKS